MVTAMTTARGNGAGSSPTGAAASAGADEPTASRSLPREKFLPITRHALLDPMDRRLEHLHPGEALLLARDDVPRGEVVVGALEHLLGGAGVGRGLLAVAPVLGGDLPAPQRVVLAVLEAAQLFE